MSRNDDPKKIEEQIQKIMKYRKIIEPLLKKNKRIDFNKVLLNRVQKILEEVLETSKTDAPKESVDSWVIEQFLARYDKEILGIIN